MKKNCIQALFAMLFFVGIVFFGCSNSESPEPVNSSSSNNNVVCENDGSCDPVDPGDSSSSNNIDNNDSSSSGDIEGNDSSSSNYLEGASSSSSSDLEGTSSSSSDISSSSSVTIASSSSVSPGANCSYKPEWCKGIEFSDIITASQTRELGDGPNCVFATAIEKMGNQSEGAILVNGIELQGQYGSVGGRCGNTDWSQKTCANAMADANVQKVDGGYYIYVEEWAGDFITTGGTPVCGSNSGSSASNLTCTGLSTTGTAGTAITQPTVSCNGTTVNSGITWSGNPTWSNPTAATYNVTASATCGGSNVTANCGSIIVSAASSLTCAGLSQTGTAGTAITQPTVSCNGTTVTSGITWSGNPTWSNPTAATYNVTARANCGGSNITANCGSITVNPAPVLTCINLPQTGVAGTEITQPTVMCDNTIITSGITWISAPTWASPTAGTYNNVRASVSSGTCSGQTANCSGTLVVSAAPTITCDNVPTTGTAGTAITPPVVRCNGSTVASVTWSGAPNWDNPTAATYNNVKATATVGNCNGRTADCGGTLVVSAPASLDLTCGTINQTITVGTAITNLPTVRCGTTTVSSGITWKNGSTTINWNSLSAGTYSDINATATCDGGSKTANCSGTVTVNSSSSGSGSDPSYPTLQQGGSGVQKGYATRYWDACKANCSWSGKTQALGTNTRCKNCSSDGVTEIAANDNNKSSCDGGNAYTCFDQAPYKVNDNLSYAFAATPGNGNDCGKCYQLQFTNTAISGKTLIVMSSNIGYDVSGGQFDIMIPGGGVGAYNALTNQIKNLGGPASPNLGAQYGGLLTKCQESLGWGNSGLASCVKSECATVFSGDKLKLLKDGCDWFADWYKVADNPELLYKQVDCPDYLINKYKATLF